MEISGVVQEHVVWRFLQDFPGDVYHGRGHLTHHTNLKLSAWGSRDKGLFKQQNSFVLFLKIPDFR